MIKWFAYIVLILIFAPCLLFAGAKNRLSDPVYSTIAIIQHYKIPADTILAKNAKDEKNKIKEVAKPKKQAKPTKVDDSGEPVTSKPKPKRQRRPEGMERPPEIPRRNGN
ncbi:hypothetical protein [Mucilaginibacter sp. SG564]|uniref:hypothetical protein n=1 Tax=unclassified Mucilaginibacter TaxID=2617802 RepID=UPI0015528896|nr:hypothetical protein [Mucilaginibacter sp. SG564]NOW94397.1 hypothetical protein [Mucilaginibacter sp. SG564]